MGPGESLGLSVEERFSTSLLQLESPRHCPGWELSPPKRHLCPASDAASDAVEQTQEIALVIGGSEITVRQLRLSAGM